MTATPPPAHMVGRIEEPEALDGGAVLIMKAARKAGGWFVWATRGTVSRPEKTVLAKDNNGTAVYEERLVERVLVKGRRVDGRRFVVQYVAGKVESAYLLTRHHRATMPGFLLSITSTKASTDPEPMFWQSERPSFTPASVSDVKGYMNAEGPL